MILPAHVVIAAARRRRPRQRLGDPHRPVAPRDPPPAGRRAHLATDLPRDRRSRSPPPSPGVSLTGHGVGGSGAVTRRLAVQRDVAQTVAIVDAGRRRLPRDRRSPGRGPHVTRRSRRTSTSAPACSSSSARWSGAPASATTTRSTCSSPGSRSSRRRPPPSRSGRSGSACAPPDAWRLAIVVLVLCGIQLELGVGPQRTSSCRLRARRLRAGPGGGPRPRSRTCRRTPSSPTPASRSRSSRPGMRTAARPRCPHRTADRADVLRGRLLRPAVGAGSPPTSRTRSSSGRRSGRSTRMRTPARRRRAWPRSSRRTGSTTSTRIRCIRTRSSRTRSRSSRAGDVQVLRLP